MVQGLAAVSAAPEADGVAAIVFIAADGVAAGVAVLKCVAAVP